MTALPLGNRSGFSRLVAADTIRWTRIYFGWRPNLPDEGDNHLIELAMAGGASCIVTRNIRHLTVSELKFPDIVAVTPPNSFAR